MSKPVVVQLPTGEEYGVETPAIAARVYPEGKIVRHQDGSAYEAPATKDTKSKDDK